MNKKFSILKVEKSKKYWTWITGKGEFLPEKHDTLINERNNQRYSVHTEDTYENKWAIWAGPDREEIDLVEGDVLIIDSWDL